MMKNWMIRLFIILAMQGSITYVGAPVVMHSLNASVENTGEFHRPQPKMTVKIENADGQLVYNKNIEVGAHPNEYVQINRRDFSGVSLPDGAYYYTIQMHDQVVGKGQLMVHL